MLRRESSVRMRSGVHALDARAAVRRGGGEARLPAEQGDDRVAELLDRHREQRSRNLLARREELVHLALRGLFVDFLRLCDEVVRRIALRGNNDHDVVARTVGRRDDIGDVEQPLGVAHGRAAELLNDQCHRITHSFLPGAARPRGKAAVEIYSIMIFAPSGSACRISTRQPRMPLSSRCEAQFLPKSSAPAVSIIEMIVGPAPLTYVPREPSS